MKIDLQIYTYYSFSETSPLYGLRNVNVQMCKCACNVELANLLTLRTKWAFKYFVHDRPRPVTSLDYTANGSGITIAL
jgi:hypothetical protein